MSHSALYYIVRFNKHDAQDYLMDNMLDLMVFLVSIYISACRVKLTLHNYFEFIMLKPKLARGVL